MPFLLGLYSFTFWQTGTVKKEQYLVIDGGAELNQQEAVGNHGEDTQGGGEEDRQPDVRLAQRVSARSWINTHVRRFCVCTLVSDDLNHRQTALLTVEL